MATRCKTATALAPGQRRMEVATASYDKKKMSKGQAEALEELREKGVIRFKFNGGHITSKNTALQRRCFEALAKKRMANERWVDAWTLEYTPRRKG